MQNKAKVKISKMNISIAIIKDYDNEQQTTNNERYSKQTQSKPISKSHKNIKGAGTKKGVRNFCWVSAARKDILLFMGNPILA